MTATMTAEDVAERFGLAPLPAEGGLYRRTWVGPRRGDGRPEGSAILVLLTAGDGFSGLHRLSGTELWHRYLGDPVELLLMDDASGTSRVDVLGPDLADGHEVQVAVPGGTWMGARVAPGGDWALCGTTMAPGFTPREYEGGDAAALSARHPERAELIRALHRPEAPLRMPAGVDQ